MLNALLAQTAQPQGEWSKFWTEFKADPNWPVWLFVAAWLLPAVSFLLLFIGGKKWGKAAAYIATAAIFGSFLLSFYGLIQYKNQFSVDFFASVNPHEGGAAPHHEGAKSDEGSGEHAAPQPQPPPETPAKAGGANRPNTLKACGEEGEVDPLDVPGPDDAGNPAPAPAVEPIADGTEQSAQDAAKSEATQEPKPADSTTQEPPKKQEPTLRSAAPNPAGGGGGAARTGDFSPKDPPPSSNTILPGTAGMSDEEARAALAKNQLGSRRKAKSEFGVWQWSGKWITVGTATDAVLRMGFYVDNLTVIMFFMISMVATLIHVFSIGYMSEELQKTVHDHQAHVHRAGRFPRFFTYMSLFCFSMLGLVLADNVFMVFMFWELVGLCSYLLIGFYYERSSASTAANKAFITNRVGDAGMIVGLMIIWTSLGTFNIQDAVRVVRNSNHQFVRLDERTKARLVWDGNQGAWLAERDEPSTGKPGDVLLWHVTNRLPRGTMNYWLLTAAGIGIFIGCVGKSAQFPLHVWLPDAMEGPTPVSALIHAATMVAAGVYLVGRFYAIFTPEALLVIAYTGGITLFMAGTIAVVMTDIKKVLAYSTVSQLGYMMLGLGVGGWAAGLFHLLTHAFFKALMFLASGSVIYGCHHEQDMTKMGGLWKKMPITTATMLVGVLAICGIPYFSGFYSKDAIVGQALAFWQGDADAVGGGILAHPKHALLFFLPVVGAAITAFYMFRMYFMTFLGEPRDAHVHQHAKETGAVMWLPLLILAVPSFIVGWSFNGEGPLLARILGFRPPFAPLQHPSEFVHELGGHVALGAVLFGIALSTMFYLFRVLNPGDVARQFPRLHDFLLHKWYFDELYDAMLVRPAHACARFCRNFDWNVLDRFIDGTARWTVKVSQADGRFDHRIVDGAVNWMSDVVYATGLKLRRVQTGQLRQYVLFLVVATVGLFTLISFLGLDVLKSLIAK